MSSKPSYLGSGMYKVGGIPVRLRGKMMVIHHVRRAEYVAASTTTVLVIRHLKRGVGVERCKSVVLEHGTSRQVV